MIRHSPRRLLAAVAAAAVLALGLAGCATGAQTAPAASDSASAADAFPVTIDHAFGSTTIESKPERVVTWGWGSTDAALALGVVPVAIPFQSYGGDAEGVLPWIASKLSDMGEKTPTVLPDSTDAPPYEAIAKAAPDVILAPYSGITKEQYDLLTQIAPTVAYPKTAWSTSPKDVVSMVGKALGLSSEATALNESLDTQVADAAAAHPEFAGKSIEAVAISGGTFYVYKPADPRVGFLNDLGFTNAPSVEAQANGDQSFYYTVSTEQVSAIDAQVLLAYWPDQATADAWYAQGVAQTIPAVKNGVVANIVGTEYVAAVSPPTALSLPYALDEFVKALSAATAKLG